MFRLCNLCIINILFKKGSRTIAKMMSVSQLQQYDKKEEKWAIRVRHSEMDRETEHEAKHVIHHAVLHRSNEQEIAEEVKKYMDKKFFGGWFAIVGRNFGMDVTHEEGTFLHAIKGPLQIIIFRCSN